VVILEDQLKDITEEEVKQLIQLLLERYHEEYIYNYKKGNEKGKIYKYIVEESPFDDDDNEEKQTSVEEQIDFSEETIDYICDKIKKLYEGKNQDISDESNFNEDYENSKKYLTMSSFNKFCRTIMIFFHKFRSYTNISQESIINFSFELLFEEQLSDDNKIILDIFKDELINSNKQIKKDLKEERYYFDKSESLIKFMIQLYACSLVNQHLCIVGPPGIGKTIGVRTFSYLREIIFGLNYKCPFYMHTFNQFTRPSDYFGISSLKDDKLIFKDGTLTKSCKEGVVFIGDEFNISSENCMKAISPALELKFNKKIIH